MREKLLLLTVAALGLILVSSQAQAPSSRQLSTVGRYQLYGSDLPVVSPQAGTASYVKMIFRIDTQTGTTWTAIGSPENGSKIIWRPVQETQPLK
jgi:hypothetical protein